MGHESKPGYYATRPYKSGELCLLRLAKDANIDRAKAAQNQLIRENEGFLRVTVSKWLGKNPHIDFDALLQDARVAFLKAIKGYDLHRDVSIRSYARYYLLEVQKQSFKKSSVVELSEGCSSGRLLPANPDFKEFDLLAIMESAIGAVLNSTEAEVINLHFFNGLKKNAIAAQRGVSPARIGAIINTALKKLKLYLSRKGIAPGFLELN